MSGDLYKFSEVDKAWNSLLNIGSHYRPGLENKNKTARFPEKLQPITKMNMGELVNNKLYVGHLNEVIIYIEKKYIMYFIETPASSVGR